MTVIDVNAEGNFHRERSERLLAGWVEGEENGNIYIGETESNNMARVKQDFFARRADYVAQELLGRTLVLKTDKGIKKARLVEIAAYNGATKTTSEGASYAPGLISISQKRGRYLIDIATGKRDKKEDDSSCITLRAAEVEVQPGKLELIEGPGNLAKKLGVNKKTREEYEFSSAYGRSAWVEGEPVHKGQIEWKKGNSDNCMGFYFFKSD